MAEERPPGGQPPIAAQAGCIVAILSGVAAALGFGISLAAGLDVLLALAVSFGVFVLAWGGWVLKESFRKDSPFKE